MSLDAMKQALEALETGDWYIGQLELLVYTADDTDTHRERAKVQAAITALRAAIEQAQRNEFAPDWDAMAVMVTEQQRMAKRIEELEAQPEQKPVAWVYPEGLEALKSGKPWVAYGRDGNGAHPDGVERIPLYLNDAVALRVEPRFGGSGAGFESLPASPKWQGLTDNEIALICGECAASYADDIRYARAIEAKLKEKNT